MFRGQLFPFQEVGVRRMLKMQRLLVAYEMGLGKSIMTIATIETLVERGEVGTGWIICPAPLKYQWRSQIEKFTDGALVCIIEGTREQRQRQYLQVRRGEYEYVILNYEQIVNDWAIVRHLPRDFLVADEIAAIKSFHAKRSRRLKRLDAPYKFGLTGQPVENRPEDLYSIMQWINPDVLGRFDYFDHLFLERDSFGRVRRVKNLPLLRKRMRQHMVRCTQAEVADQLPRVLEEHIPVLMDAVNRRLYNHIRADLLEDLTNTSYRGTFDLDAHYGHETEGSSAQGQVMSKMLALRMLCDHAQLIETSAAQFAEPPTRPTQLQRGSEYAATLVEGGHLRRFPRPIKFEVACDLIDEILAERPDNKVVIFSFFKEMGYMFATRYKDQAVVFNGDLNAREKARAKEQFAHNPNIRLFCSSDAGGVGLDLPEANYLINFDLPWSAGAFAQRMSRIIRLSSEWEHVTLISLTVKGSIEERQHAMLHLKSNVAAAIVDGTGFDIETGALDLDLETLTSFLQESAI